MPTHYTTAAHARKLKVHKSTVVVEQQFTLGGGSFKVLQLPCGNLSSAGPYDKDNWQFLNTLTAR